MKKQQGFVLIFTVILLFVAAMMGLYAMRSTITQDKMTANLNNKTITTNVAEHGASVFYEWAKDYFAAHDWPTSSDEKDDWTGIIPNVNTGEINSGTNGYYWINPDLHPAGCSSNPCWDDDTKQVTVLITGNLIKGSGENRVVLGESVYQIKIAAPGGLKLPDMPAPLTLAGNISSFSGASSNNFSVVGGSNKVAIATTNAPSNQEVIDELISKDSNGNKKSNNYSGSCASTPCVSSSENMGVWANPTELMTYINSIKNDPSVHYVNGSVTQKSQLDLSKPVNIITGNLTQNGTLSDYTGVIIVLGANASTINGGGNTTINGAMYFANVVQNNGSYSFGDVGLTINGGGKMNINYDGTYFGNSNTNGVGYATQTTILSWSDTL